MQIIESVDILLFLLQFHNIDKNAKNKVTLIGYDIEVSIKNVADNPLPYLRLMSILKVY